MTTTLTADEQFLFQMMVTQGPCSRTAIKKEMKGISNLNNLLSKMCEVRDGKYHLKQVLGGDQKVEEPTVSDDQGTAYIFSGNYDGWTSSYLPPDMMSAVVVTDVMEQDPHEEIEDKTLNYLLCYQPNTYPIVSVPSGDTEEFINQLHEFSLSQLSPPTLPEITSMDAYSEYLKYYNELSLFLATTNSFLDEARAKQSSIPQYAIDTLIAIDSRTSALEMELNRVVIAVKEFVFNCRRELL